jgi:hypothetical protein
MSHFPRSQLLAILTALSALFALTSCESPPKDAFAEAAAGGEKPVAMSGAADFFAGQLTATVTVSRGLGRKGGDAHGGGPGGGARGARRGGSGGGSRPYGGGAPDVSTMEPEEAESYLRARQAMGSPLPPVTTHLKLENHGAAAVEVEITEVSSDLGNFAVRPAKLTIAPGQTAEPDPMISQLGVTSDEILVKVALRMAGAKETHALAVKSIRAADAPAVTK